MEDREEKLFPCADGKVKLFQLFEKQKNNTVLYSE